MPRVDTIALALQQLLDEFSDDGTFIPANPFAARLLREQPQEFARVVEECVHASQRVQRGEPPYTPMPYPDAFARGVRKTRV